MKTQIKSVQELQDEIKNWSLNNFGNQPSYRPLLGIGEEVGELNHAFLKTEQGIRTDENHREKMKDALGDIFIYMCDFAARENIDLFTEIVRAWDKVKARNWKKYPDSGGLPPKSESSDIDNDNNNDDDDEWICDEEDNECIDKDDEELFI